MHPFYAGEVQHHLSDGRTRRFKPVGPMHPHKVGGKRRRGAREDSIEDWGAAGRAARLFVGLNVGETPTYTIEQVVQATKELRRAEGAPPDATFIAQKGLYTEPPEKGAHLIEENSVQIIIFDTEGSELDVFGAKIVELARGLREKFDQDSVIVELQKAGISQKVMAVKR